MSIIVTEKQNNQALISALSLSKSQAIASVLIIPSTPPSVAYTDSSDAINQTAFNITTLAQSYPAIIIKLNRILRK